VKNWFRAFAFAYYLYRYIACLAGVSPLDPRTVASVLAICAGADGPAVRRSMLSDAERRAEIASREAAAREAAAAAAAAADKSPPQKSPVAGAGAASSSSPLSPLGGALHVVSS
jgi:hypothetical protein